MSSFSAKVVVITGASSGLGQAMALAMAEKGACLTLCGRDKGRLDAVLQECLALNNNQPERLITVAGDVASRDCRKQIIDQTVQKFGRLDILIPNAGIVLPDLDLDHATEEDYDKIMDTDLKSVFFLIQAAVPHLEKSKGVIVCVSSLMATIPSAQFLVYAVAKAALDHMVRCLAFALGPKGIRVNAVKPGYVPTEITRSYPDPEYIKAAILESTSPLHPLEGRCGTAEEIAKATLFLASSDSSFVTGELLHVEGGRRFNSE